MKKLTTVAASAAIVASFAAGNVIAAENQFAMQQLENGYNVAMSEGTCGGDKGKEAKCGEGKCGEGKADGDKAKEAKCGEGKCGEGKK